MGLAYRMLGSRVQAEDVVQDAYLRWHAAERDVVAAPRRYLGGGRAARRTVPAILRTISPTP